MRPTQQHSLASHSRPILSSQVLKSGEFKAFDYGSENPAKYHQVGAAVAALAAGDAARGSLQGGAEPEWLPGIDQLRVPRVAPGHPALVPRGGHAGAHGGVVGRAGLGS